MKLEIEPHDLMIIYAALRYTREHREVTCRDLTIEFFNSSRPLEFNIEKTLRQYLKDHPEQVEAIHFMQQHNLLDSKRPLKLIES